MNRKQMIELLEKGEHSINVAIQKWIDISNVQSKNILRARHQFDDGEDNCALCYAYKDCALCPVFLKYKVKCCELRMKRMKNIKKIFIHNIEIQEMP